MFVGLDFGTSNSALGYVHENEVVLTLFEGKSTLPSAIFYDFEEDETLFGQQAMAEYIEGTQGRLLRALKSILGTELMGEKTQIKRQYLSFEDILISYISQLKLAAEKQAGMTFSKAVFGRPVHFIDDDEQADKEAEEQLKQVGYKAGFKEIHFLKEPEAAAYEFAHKVRKNTKAIIIDIGGGTADFSVIETTEKAQVKVLSNMGVHIGGTDIDKILSLRKVMPELGYGLSMKNDGHLKMPVHVYHDLATWYKIPFLYEDKAINLLKQKRFLVEKPYCIDRFIYTLEHQLGHKIAADVEALKVKISSHDNLSYVFKDIEPSFEIDLTKVEFETIIKSVIEKLRTKVLETIKDAGLEEQDIEAIFFTGGTSHIPYIRRQISGLFTRAEVVEGDMFASVARGLVLKGQELYSTTKDL